MSWFSKSKDVLKDEDTIDINQIETYLDSFFKYHKLDKSMFLLKEISVEKKEKFFLVVIKAGFPGILIGKKGSLVKSFSAGLSKFVNKSVKVAIEQ